MSELRIQLVNELLDNRHQFLSGEELSGRLHVSRTAIWKHIEELRKEGYVIDAVRKQGYKLITIPDILSPSTILPYLQTEWLGQQLHVYDEVNSTQEVAHQLAREGAPSGTLVLANYQTKGKGRLGREWFSTPGTGLWMSLIVRPDIPLSMAPQLTLVTCVGLLRGLRQATALNIGIKWPNDLLIDQKKIAGILTELSAETDRINYIIIGVGINVNQKLEDYPEHIQQIVTSLSIEKGEVIDRNQLLITILKEWEDIYDLYLKHGFSPIKTLWEMSAVSIGKPIRAKTLQGEYEGLCEGITSEGALLLKDAEGKIQQIFSADIET